MGIVGCGNIAGPYARDLASKPNLELVALTDLDSLEENLEYFSADGKPLRATLAVSLSQQKITRFFDPNSATAGS